MNYYKIWMDLHKKPTAIYRPFALPLHSTYHKAYTKYRVGASGQYKSYWKIFGRFWMSSTTTTTEIRRIRWSRACAQVWLRKWRWSLRPLLFYAYSDDCSWRRYLHLSMPHVNSDSLWRWSLHPPTCYVYSNDVMCAFLLVYVVLRCDITCCITL